MLIIYKILLLLLIVIYVKAQQNDLTQSQQWIYGFLTGFGLSLLGFVAAIILISLKKCLNIDFFKKIVNILYSLACGALIGDALIHIIPDAYANQDNDTQILSFIFIAAIAFFIILQRIFQSLGIAHQHWESQHQHGGEHSQNSLHNHQSLLSEKSTVVIEQKDKGWLANLKGKGIAGYLNILSSFLHNFFDGLGIGISFATGDLNIITPMIVAIIAHQIPRELGDVGILIKNGFSGIQTVMCNGFINFMSLFGVFAGLGLGNISEEAQDYCLIFVAGNFVYISADIWKNIMRNKSFCSNMVEFLSFSLGVGSMFLVLLAQSTNDDN